METTTTTVGQIGWAVHRLREGKRLRRRSWTNNKLWIAYVPADATQIPHKFGDGLRTDETLMLRIERDGQPFLVPWAIPINDLFGSDWEIVQ